MEEIRLTNDEIWKTDFAEDSRKAFLRKIAKSKPPRKSPVYSSYSVGQLIDLSADRRSVKAQLAGRGDFRTRWWHLNYLLHRIFFPGSTLEQTMISFHRRHHAVTFFRLRLLRDFREINHEIRKHGLWAGTRCAVNQASRVNYE
jgi:hypothetical protein